VSISPKVIIGLPLTNTVPLVLVVVAEQCTGGQPLRPQQGCGDTLDPTTATGRLLINTVESPVSITPPAAFLSPTLQIDPGMLSH
jgi:hypothetical protein